MLAPKSPYRRIGLGIWASERFRRLSPLPPSGQSLFLYLCCGPFTGTIPGLIVAGEAAMAEERGWSLKAFREAFVEAFREGMVEADWEARVIIVWKALPHNPPANPNVVKAWGKAWNAIPSCALKSKYYQHIKAFTEGLGEAFGKAFAEAFGETEAEAEAEAGTEAGLGSEAGRIAEKTPRPARRTTPTSDAEWITGLKVNPTYSGLDIDREIGKASAWLEANRPQRKVTRPFIINWLNRAEKPLGGSNGTDPKPSRWTGLAEKDYTKGLDEHGRIKLAGSS